MTRLEKLKERQRERGKREICGRNTMKGIERERKGLGECGR